MFKPGDKYIIEIETVYEGMPEHSLVNPIPKICNHLYRIKGFNSLIMDSYGLSKLERVKWQKGPQGIGCVMREYLPHIKPKNRPEVVEWMENGIDPNNAQPEKDPWIVTHVDMHEDGTWTYTGMTNKGEEVKYNNTDNIYYTGLFFNTVLEWARYEGPIK